MTELKVYKLYQIGGNMYQIVYIEIHTDNFGQKYEIRTKTEKMNYLDIKTLEMELLNKGVKIIDVIQS